MIGLIKPTYVTIKIEGLSKLCKMFGQLEAFFSFCPKNWALWMLKIIWAVSEFQAYYKG